MEATLTVHSTFYLSAAYVHLSVIANNDFKYLSITTCIWCNARASLKICITKLQFTNLHAYIYTATQLDIARKILLIKF